MTTVAAGIDVGNSTTEVVVGHLVDGRLEILAAGRAPTRRGNGSPESLDGAAALLRRLEREHGIRVEVAVAAPLRPVVTATVTVPEELPGTGRLRVVRASAGTAGGDGVGVGRPHVLGTAVSGEDALVAVVPAGTGYLRALELLAPLAESGRLAGVVLADDEAVLVANRLAAKVPVVDEVDVEEAGRADLLAVEVSVGGRPLRALADPLRLAEMLRLAEGELTDAAALGALLLDATNAVVAVDGTPAAAAVNDRGWVEVSGAERVPLTVGARLLREGPVGLASAYALPPAGTAYNVDDLWALDLAAVAEQVQARRGGVPGRPVSLASLRADTPYADPAQPLRDRLGVPVHTVASEAAAARRGALSTPGTTEATVVVDLGGGTVDTVSARTPVVAAGGGELLTVSVAALTGISTAAAEHVKRGPAYRVDAPQMLLAEDGSRTFLDRPAAREAVGSLVVNGPAGLLPFHRTLAPGEWRALRLRLKVDLVGGNVARAIRTLDLEPRTVVVVGGPAGDDEVLAAVSGALPKGTAVGRGNVGGTLGHRYAVAYGLLCARALDTTAP